VIGGHSFPPCFSPALSNLVARAFVCVCVCAECERAHARACASCSLSLCLSLSLALLLLPFLLPFLAPPRCRVRVSGLGTAIFQGAQEDCTDPQSGLYGHSLRAPCRDEPIFNFQQLIFNFKHSYVPSTFSRAVLLAFFPASRRLPPPLSPEPHASSSFRTPFGVIPAPPPFLLRLSSRSSSFLPLSLLPFAWAR